MRFERPRRGTSPRAMTVLVVVAAVVAAGACAPAPAPEDTLFTPVVLPACNANADGIIEHDEMPFVVGATARVRVGENVPVDVAGAPASSVGGGGSARVWDLSRPDPDSEPVGLLTLQSMDGQWFAGDFPDADYAGPLAPGGGLLGPLVVDADGVKLLGSVSADESPPEGRTELAYQDPVMLYPFPLQVGTHAVTETQAVDGVAQGIPVAVDDTYTIDVTAHGKVILKDLVLEDALRVTVRLERVPVAGIAVQQVTQVFVNECVGEVARFVSPFVPLDQELPDDFDVAEQVWRLSL